MPVRWMSRSLTCLFAALVLSACGENQNESVQANGMAKGFAASTAAKIKMESTAGAKLTRRKCQSCHYLDRNIRKVGPSLKGIYGRTPLISGVPFATWDEAALDQWLADPKGVKPSTRMAIPGIKEAQDRQDIIAYLKLL
jgi:cytochrome c